MRGASLCRFNFDEMLNLNGNTAVYMLYAHARIASIIRKVGKDVNEVAKTSKISLDHPTEVSSFQARHPAAPCLPLHETRRDAIGIQGVYQLPFV